ncbi:MAG: uroporphyrinogen-III C-methyltransferase [Chloroflexi bacterium]|nr:uroporphyrinogen-III C-methyltransferase [Chloroflexota bacterium]
MKIGTVYLVGAGPGDPDLITRKGLRLLRRADVVVHDRLIARELLAETRPDAELIDAGKQPKRQRLAQAQINAALVDRALQGFEVVRLKGGDPFIFGRGGEEALACRERGIPFAIVPGVSSAHAVPAYAGIPLSHRHISSSFTVITGHEDPAKGAASVNYRALAEIGGTIVIMMGVKQLAEISGQLLEYGMDEQVPAAIIEAGTLPIQRALVGKLGTIARLARERDIKPPAITVVGDVVSLRAQGVAWFDQLPDAVLAATLAPAIMP